MTLVLILFIAFSSTFTTLLALNKFAPSIGLLDQPSSRKVHSKHTPLTGGLAIAIGVSLTLVFVAPNMLDDYIWIFTGAILMVLSGAYDDLKTLSVTHRFLIQSTVAILVIYAGNIQITSLGTYPFIGLIELGYLSYPITFFAILAGVNAFNLIDGLDGLASGLCFVAFFTIGLLASIAGHLELIIFSAIFSMAIIGFLSKNMRFPWQKSAKAFLGDAGSTALGFTLACLVIHSSHPDINIMSPTTALWLLALPLIDTLSVIIRRKQNGQNPFKASKDHLHHILLERFESVSTVVTLMILGSIGLTAIGTALDFYGSDGLSLGFFIIAALGHHLSANFIRKKVVPEQKEITSSHSDKTNSSRTTQDQEAA